jgi:hypothetical protein
MCEGLSIGPLIAPLRRVFRDIDVLVVEDGSTDYTVSCSVDTILHRTVPG